LTEYSVRGRKYQEKNRKKGLTEYPRSANIETMRAEKDIKQHSFHVMLDRQDSERLEVYLRESGMKKRAFMQKAILKYLGEQEQREHEG
jgi:hypothetical protein